MEQEHPQSRQLSQASHGQNQPRRIFLISPANASGVRAKMLFNERSQFELALRIRKSGAPLGEIYNFISGLYFCGKLTYAKNFLNPPAGVPGVHIITPAAGLVSPGTVVDLTDLRRISSADVDSGNRLYRTPLNRDARILLKILEPGTEVVLLGSIATSKYVEPLLEVFGYQYGISGGICGAGRYESRRPAITKLR